MYIDSHMMKEVWDKITNNKFYRHYLKLSHNTEEVPVLVSEEEDGCSYVVVDGAVEYNDTKFLRGCAARVSGSKLRKIMSNDISEKSFKRLDWKVFF